MPPLVPSFWVVIGAVPAWFKFQEAGSILFPFMRINMSTNRRGRSVDIGLDTVFEYSCVADRIPDGGKIYKETVS